MYVEVTLDGIGGGVASLTSNDTGDFRVTLEVNGEESVVVDGNELALAVAKCMTLVTPTT